MINHNYLKAVSCENLFKNTKKFRSALSGAPARRRHRRKMRPRARLACVRTPNMVYCTGKRKSADAFRAALRSEPIWAWARFPEKSAG